MGDAGTPKRATRDDAAPLARLNPRGIAFHRKAGFAALGEQVFVLGSEAQRALVMVRAVAAGQAPPA